MTLPNRPQHPFAVRHRDVWGIALPASIAFITEPMVGIVDITVVGRLGDAGLLGGLVLGALVFDFIFSLAYFLRIGTAGLTAQAVGARDPRDGLLHVARAILLALLAGVLLIALAGPLLALANLLLAPEAAGAADQGADEGADERRGDEAQQAQQDRGEGQDEAAGTSSASAAEPAEGSDGANDAGEASEPT